MTQLNHDQAALLLPWLVNGTLSGAELDSVETHVRSCVTCRLMLREQLQLEAAIQAQPTVPLSPEQGFERLLQQMNLPDAAPRTRRAPLRFGFMRSQPRVALAAAAVAASGVGVWLAAPPSLDRAIEAYSTLSASPPVASAGGVRLDLVFATSATEADMRRLLNEIDATIVGGPSDLGRYTVQLNTTTSTVTQVGKLIEQLAGDRRIRFAGRSLMDAAE